MKGTHLRLAVLFLFLFSGASGLIYQIVWTKQLAHIMGVTVYAITTVLASFMAGLALGSYLFGKWADRIKKPLVLYAVLEGGIGIYAIIMPLLLWLITQAYVGAHGTLSQSHSLLMFLRFVLCFVTLLIPTTLMGGTLPVLTKFFVQREKTIGLGVGGCFCAGFILIPSLGVSRTIWIAVIINLAVAIVAYVISLFAATPAIEESPRASDRKESGAATVFSSRTATLVFWIIGLSGFAALGYEVLWTRILIYALGPSTYAFTAMLTTFLVGIALGSWVISRYTDRMRNAVIALGFIELGMGMSTLGALLLIDRMFTLLRFFKGTIESSSWGTNMLARFAMTFVFLFLPTFFMGAAFPLAAKIYSRGLDTLGKRVGRIYSINTLFGILGSLATGFIFIPWLGLQRGMVILIIINLALGLVLFLASPARRWTIKAGLVCIAVLCCALAGIHFENKPVVLTCRHLLERKIDQNFDVVYCKEGIDASLAVLEGRDDGMRELNINGTSTAYASVADLKVHRLLSHIPMALHPDPRKVLVIGFGMGVTAYGTLQYDVEYVDCVELVEDELETASYFDQYNRNVIDDERFHFFAEDGRNFVLTTQKKYDVISMNAIHPSLAPSLYAHEFYTQCRAKMAPGGFMCVWLPTTMLSPDEMRMLLYTFQDVFTETTLWYNNPAHVILLGSVAPYKVNFQKFCEHLDRPGVKEDLAQSGYSDPYTFLGLLIMSSDEVVRFTRGVPLNTDDMPYVEFSRSFTFGFSEEIMEEMFFSAKADPAAMLINYGDSENERRRVQHNLDLYRMGWPLMVEGELIMWNFPDNKGRDTAFQYFERSMHFTPNNDALLLMAHDMHRSGGYHFLRVQKAKEKVSAKSGNVDFDTWMELAELYIERIYFKEALEILESLDAPPMKQNPRFHKLLASAHAGTGACDKAIAILKEVIQRLPEDDDAKVRLAWLLLTLDDEGARIDALRLAKEVNQKKSTVQHLHLLGVALEENGQYSEADQILSKALEITQFTHYAYRFHLAGVKAALEAKGQ
ncbi:MAG: fused MFS/spermidine synthase [Planctomycetota bacterium]